MRQTSCEWKNVRLRAREQLSVCLTWPIKVFSLSVTLGCPKQQNSPLLDWIIQDVFFLLHHLFFFFVFLYFFMVFHWFNNFLFNNYSAQGENAEISLHRFGWSKIRFWHWPPVRKSTSFWFSVFHVSFYSHGATSKSVWIKRCLFDIRFTLAAVMHSELQLERNWTESLVTFMIVHQIKQLSFAVCVALCWESQMQLRG